MLFIPFRELPPITTAMTLTTGAWFGLNRLSRIQSGRVFTPDSAVKVVTMTIEGEEGTEHHGHDGARAAICRYRVRRQDLPRMSGRSAARDLPLIAPNHTPAP